MVLLSIYVLYVFVVFSVIFKIPHPLRPIVWPNATVSGPGAGLVICFMPLERPQFFEPDFSDRKVQKGRIDISIMSIDAEALHVPGGL